MPRRTGLLTIVFVLLICGIVVACPDCQDSVANTDAKQATNVAAGYNASIYLMLGAFFAVLGLVLRVLVKAVRSSQS